MLVMFLYLLYISCSRGGGGGYRSVAGGGVHFFWFSRMVFCVGHFGNVIVWWASDSWISVGCVGSFVSRSTIVLEGDRVAPNELPSVIW